MTGTSFSQQSQQQFSDVDSTNNLQQQQQQLHPSLNSQAEASSESQVPASSSYHELQPSESQDANSNYPGMFVHGTDVSASFSQLPANQLDSFTESKATSDYLQQLRKQGSSAIKQAQEKLQKFAASLKATKDSTDASAAQKSQKAAANILIVGGGEIADARDYAENTSDYSQQVRVVPHRGLSTKMIMGDRQRSEGAIFESQQETRERKINSSLLNIQKRNILNMNKNGVNYPMIPKKRGPGTLSPTGCQSMQQMVDPNTQINLSDSDNNSNQLNNSSQPQYNNIEMKVYMNSNTDGHSTSTNRILMNRKAGNGGGGRHIASAQHQTQQPRQQTRPQQQP